MPSYEHGQKITHKLSRQNYYYMGVHPHSTALHVISPEDGSAAYTIPTAELNQYYELAVDDVMLEANTLYLNRWGAKTHVVEIFSNPQTHQKVAFGWAESNGGNLYHTTINEPVFHLYTKVS